MTLQELLKAGRLRAHKPSGAEVQRMLAAVRRNLADAAVTRISDETRFDAAYKAVMQCALVALLAAGYRPATNQAGHHQLMIQSLPLTLGIDNDGWVVLDGLRRQRNANDYTGQPITVATLQECIAQATALEKTLFEHLHTRYAHLLAP